MSLRYQACLLTCLLVAFAADDAFAQMVTIGTPMHTVGDSFYERFGLNWQARAPGFFATFGGNTATPPFGGYTPNAGVQGGFTFSGGPFTGGLNFSAAQGASRSMTSYTPSVTTLNGYPGFIQNSVQRPFVIGYVPVVGVGAVGYAPIVTGLDLPPQMAPLSPQLPWQGMLREHGLKRQPAKSDDEDAPVVDAPVVNAPRGGGGAGADNGQNGLIDPLPPTRAERERQRNAEEAARQNAARALYEKGLTAEQNGKPGVARLYFEMAARKATGALKEEIEDRLPERR